MRILSNCRIATQKKGMEISEIPFEDSLKDANLFIKHFQNYAFYFANTKFKDLVFDRHVRESAVYQVLLETFNLINSEDFDASSVKSLTAFIKGVIRRRVGDRCVSFMYKEGYLRSVDRGGGIRSWQVLNLGVFEDWMRGSDTIDIDAKLDFKQMSCLIKQVAKNLPFRKHSPSVIIDLFLKGDTGQEMVKKVGLSRSQAWKIVSAVINKFLESDEGKDYKKAWGDWRHWEWSENLKAMKLEVKRYQDRIACRRFRLKGGKEDEQKV